MKDRLLKKIGSRDAMIGVVGLGYVGLPLLIEFAKAGFKVLGLDIDASKGQCLEKGENYIKHIDASMITEHIANGSAGVTTDFARVNECDAVLICVPTPLTHEREPDMSYVQSTAEAIGPHLRIEQLIILESTTYPGTTEEIMVPILQDLSGLNASKDFFVAYSPEREDPNNKEFSTSTIPKVVGGFTGDSLDVAIALYDCIICQTVPVRDCRTAEATKLMENIFRCINIALVNELKMVFEKMNIDIWEVVKAASTKPFGYMPFYPGPGLGGHCIPIDPFYLSWKAKQSGIDTEFIELAGKINSSMPDYVIDKTEAALGTMGKDLGKSKILLVGLAYKQNVDDDRESPTYVLWEKLLAKGADVSYYDPYFPKVRHSREHASLEGNESIAWQDIGKIGFDAAIIATAHDDVDHDKLASIVPLVVDSRGVCSPRNNVVKA